MFNHNFQFINNNFPYLVLDNFLPSENYENLNNKLPNFQNIFDMSNITYSNSVHRFDVHKGSAGLKHILDKNMELSKLFLNLDNKDFFKNLLDSLVSKNKDLNLKNEIMNNLNKFEYDKAYSDFYRHKKSNFFMTKVKSIYIKSYLSHYINALKNKLYPPTVYCTYSLSYTRTGYEIPAHTDNRYKMFVILYYLTDMDEDGSLCLLRSKKNTKIEECKRYPKKDDIEIFETINIKPNTAVIIFNDNNSYHMTLPFENKLKKFIYVAYCLKNYENIFNTNYFIKNGSI